MESSPGGIAIEIPASNVAYKTPPRRLRRRLSETKVCSFQSVEEIEAKLRSAELRRQQFHETLSSKARPKPRSPSRSSHSDEDLGQRLEAKLQAAEQKRLSILAEAQMRLARLDESRQAAKTGVELRLEEERMKLGSKVKLRVQQAEINRMLIMKARRQRRASLKERTSQSILRRIARESKYKERVHAAIQQKRAAAERKRLSLLEAEKKKAHARVLQVQQVATSVSHQREIERRKLRDRLEHRLQRAKRQRAEYLRQRGRTHNSVKENRLKKHIQADLLARKLARCWRRFCVARKTTIDLAKAFEQLKVNQKSIKSMPFENLALLIESRGTLQAVKALLDRFESRLKIYKTVTPSYYYSTSDNIDHLLKRVATPKKSTPRSALRSREEKKVGSAKMVARRTATLTRYPVRIVLCAYMILGHPDAVFSGQGDREIALAKSAEVFIRELELLVRTVLEGAIQSVEEASSSTVPKCHTFRSQLAAFDKAWCSYLNCFVVWKVKDARLLEEDLVRAACRLELSMIQKCKLIPEGETGALTHDMKAIQDQVTEDQNLLREKVHHLSGDDGIKRMESALSEMRTKYFQAKESGSPLGSPVMQISAPSPSIPSAGTAASLYDESNLHKGSERPSRVVRALFKEGDSSPDKEHGSSSSRSIDGQLGSVTKLTTENEMIVNEFLHEQQYSLADSFPGTDEYQNSVKAVQEKIRKTMEDAFWDGIIESVKDDKPNFERIIQLVMEVRDEINEMAPKSWKQDIFKAIDVDILSQVLKSGNLDISYLGTIMEFSVSTLEKLCSPNMGVEMKSSHQNLMKELEELCSSDRSKHLHLMALIKGLRFVLEQIQAVKEEISKARIKMMEPLLRGPAGIEYLREAFSKRYGAPPGAVASLPLTRQWLSSVWHGKDQEWEEYSNSLSVLSSQDSSSQGSLPSTTLKTGGRFVVRSSGSGTPPDAVKSRGYHHPECDGEKVSLGVRLGLLKLVSGVSGLKQETLPETFILNLSRLRSVQAEMQKIIFISVCTLVFRQLLLSEHIVASSPDVERCLIKCTGRLMELLNHVEDVTIAETVDSCFLFLKEELKVVDEEKLQSGKAVMGRMLAKSLQAGDPVFEKVSHVVYMASRGAVLGGNGTTGRKLVEMTLRQIGSALLADRVVKAAELLIVAAMLSLSIHGPWYTCLTAAL